MRIIKTNTCSELIAFYKESPAQFFENYFGIKLTKVQKAIIDMSVNINSLLYFSRQKDYYNEYIRLLICLLNMKEDGNVAIVSSYKEKLLNREQFIDYIIEFKNQHFKK